MNEKDIRKKREEAQGRAAEFSALFKSEAGRRVLATIKSQFDRTTVCTADAHTTAIHAAQRDVVVWIEEVIDRGDSVLLKEVG